LYATYPGDVFFSTVVMPDAIQAGWLTLSVFLIVSAYHGPTRHRPWILATGGITMGFCQLIRSNGLILLPIGVVAVLLFARLEKHPFVAAVRGTLTYLAGWFFVQALEGFGYLWANGDFLHRFHVVNRHYGTMQSIAQWGLNTSSTTIPFSIFPPLLWSRVGGWGVLNQDQAYHGFIFVLALASIGLGALALRFTTVPIPERAKAGFALGVFWFAWPLLYHQFGSQSLTHFVPIHRLSRHLVVYAPGAVFAATGGCFLIAKAASAWPWAAARKALAAAGIVVLGAHLAFNWEGQLIAFEAFHGIKRTYVRIREHLPADVRTIVGDPGDLCFFDFWLNPLGTERVRVVPFANYSRCEELPDGVVLTWSNPGWMGLSAPVIQDTVRRLPCLVQTPPSWRLLYDGSPEKIFVIGPVRAVKSR
jgi:hypothetical protein